MEKFRPKTKLVDAVKLGPKAELGTLAIWCGGTVSGKALVLGEKPVALGSWIVKASDGSVSVLDEEGFRAKYEAAG